MVTLRYWNLLKLSFWIVLSVTSAILPDDDGCHVTHKETSFPRLIPRGVGGVSNMSFVTLRLKWRHKTVRVSMETHEITPGGAVSECREEEGNGTQVEALNDDTLYYQGHVLGATFSLVALSLTGEGLTGFIQMDNEGVTIEPMPHTVRRGWVLGSHVMKSCTKSQPLPQNIKHNIHKRNTGNRPRRVRGAYTKYLEVLLVADSTVTDFIGQRNIKKYLLTQMNIVNTIYQHESLGAAIEVVTVKLMYMDKTTEKSVITVRNPQRTVDQFCYWASTRAYRGTNLFDRGTNHDVAVLLTRHNFAPAGFAPITGLCVPMRNCAFVKDSGFTSAFVIAHEIAHIFGLYHDGEGNSCYGQEYTNSIMATMVKSSFNHYWWSGCSRITMATVINNLPCLNNNPLTVIKENLRDPLGIDWSLDEQCRLEFGQGFKSCSMFARSACSQMWCSDDRYGYRCTTKNVVPLEGTQCGPTRQWYCKAGECNYHGDQPPVDGSWSKWTAWSECSAGCGIGFKRRSRNCDSPKPQYNGKQCDGESENTDICKAEVCLKFEDMRASQCRLMNIVPFKGKTHEWLPYQVDKVSDQCKLSCKSVTTGQIVTFDTLVDNSTPCTYGDSTDICMDGKCVKVGCDGVPASNKKVDKCGVCEGTGDTCKTVSGTYEHTIAYSAANGNYETILIIPKGARDVVIEETETTPHLISLQDQIYHKKYLNGEKKQEASKNFVMEGAWFNYVNYYGREKVKTNGPLHGNVTVLLFPRTSRKPASVKFSYTIDNEDFTYEATMHEWRFGDWSPCSVTCGEGVQHIIYKCYSRHKFSFVDDDHCVHSPKKESDEITCNRIDCDAVKFTWRMMRDYSKCSASCGDEGMSHQLFQCESLEDGRKMTNDYCNHAPAPINLEPCNRKPCNEPTYSWKVMNSWSTCSATCGQNGTQYQQFHCSKDVGGETQRVEELFCADLPSPKEPRPCNRSPCVNYRWVPKDEWESCSHSCGQEGTQQRKAICKQFKNDKAASVVGSWNCATEDIELESRPCNVRDCFSFNWRIADGWGDCSYTCGSTGVKVRNTACYNVTYDDRERIVDDTYCEVQNKPDETVSCNRSPCVGYKLKQSGNWTDCSSQCGEEGTQKRLQICVSEITGDIVNETECDEKQSLEEDIRSCRTRPCVVKLWRIKSDWNPPCPTSCDSDSPGEQTRQVVCLGITDRAEEKHVDDNVCDHLTRPDSRRSCPVPNCNMTYHWVETDQWGECSTTCGYDGLQTKKQMCEVTNIENATHAASAEMCSDLPAIDTETRPCELPVCLRLHEDADATWSACSQTCGAGTQQKQATCYMILADGSEETANLSVCAHVNLTTSERPCEEGPCSYLEYGVGQWSPCSKTCGPGKKKRIVYCGDPHNPADFSRCPGKAPEEFEDCELAPCKDRTTKPQPSSRRRGCMDRGSFCTRANQVMCQHRTYAIVCCKSCKLVKKRRRRHWRKFRRVRHGRHAIRLR